VRQVPGVPVDRRSVGNAFYRKNTQLIAVRGFSGYCWGMNLKLPPVSAGFSLVEVTLAIGLVTFGLLSVVGTLPTGMQTLRESSEQTLHAQILASVSEGLAVSDFTGLTARDFYFDENAQPQGAAASARYKASLQPEAPSMPGVTAADLAPNLKRIRIGITRVDIPNAATSSYALQVASQ
jgi:uncharacterized protein (TIGR02598 family)